MRDSTPEITKLEFLSIYRNLWEFEVKILGIWEWGGEIIGEEKALPYNECLDLKLKR